MKLASLEAIVGALNAESVRYLVAGGLAVNAHGYIRYTQDVDLVVALDPANVVRAFRALATLGYNKGMKVLNFFSDLHRETNIDLFVTEPFDFEREYANAMQGELAPALNARFVSLPALIAMKEQAGRPRDLDDVQHLRWIVEEHKRNERT